MSCDRCGSAGSVTSCQGQKIRGPDLLEALNMHIIGEGCVRAHDMGSTRPVAKITDDTSEPASIRLKGQQSSVKQQNDKQNILAASAAVNASTDAKKDSLPVQQPVVKKRRRIQAIPDVEPDRGVKKPNAARACDIFTVKKATELPSKCTADASCPNESPSAANVRTPASHPEAVETSFRAVQQCPQPGQGAGMIEKWMEENPDRLRLPGGIGGESVGSQAAKPWSPEACLAKQEDLLYRTPTDHAYAAHLSPMKSPCAQILSVSPMKVTCRDLGGTGNVLKDVGNITTKLHNDAQHQTSPSTPKCDLLYSSAPRERYRMHRT